MKKDKILSILLGILYYILGPIFFFYLFLIELMGGNIGEFSEVLFWIMFLVIPILFMLLPLILQVIKKNKFYKSIIYSGFVIVAYILVILIVSSSINTYFKTFTPEKWSNYDWHNFRYLMINDMEKKYGIVGMSKEEVYGILGEGYESQNWQGETVISYSIRNGFLDGDNYLIYLNEDDIVIRVDTTHWN